MIKWVSHAPLGPICYHSEPSDIPYSQTSFLILLTISYSKPALTILATQETLTGFHGDEAKKSKCDNTY